MERDPPDKQHSCKAEKTRRERPAKPGRVRPASSHQRALRDGLTEQGKGTIGRARAGGCQRSDSGRGVAAGISGAEQPPESTGGRRALAADLAETRRGLGTFFFSGGIRWRGLPSRLHPREPDSPQFLRSAQYCCFNC